MGIESPYSLFVFRDRQRSTGEVAGKNIAATWRADRLCHILAGHQHALSHQAVEVGSQIVPFTLRECVEHRALYIVCDDKNKIRTCFIGCRIPHWLRWRLTQGNFE